MRKVKFFIVDNNLFMIEKRKKQSGQNEKIDWIQTDEQKCWQTPHLVEAKSINIPPLLYVQKRNNVHP